MENSKLS